MLVDDNSTGSNFLWGLLSFAIPLVGIILACVWWHDRHSNAKACLIGALIPVGMLILAMILSLVFCGIAMTGSF